MIELADVKLVYGKVLPNVTPLPEQDLARGPSQVFCGRDVFSWPGIEDGGCRRYMEIYNQTGIISEYCFECIKIVIGVNSVVELLKLLMLFERLQLPENNTRKCMVEKRSLGGSRYKGYIYCRGKEEALQLHAALSPIITGSVSSSARISVKRGCSEYEEKYPDFAPVGNVCHYPQEWEPIERGFRHSSMVVPSNVVRRPFEYFSGDLQALCFWLRFAATIGDDSYLEIVGHELPPVQGLERPAA